MTKLCLVNPPITMAQRYGPLSCAGSLLPPLNIALLAAVAREAGHEVSLLDAEAMRWSVGETVERVLALSPDLLGVTATTTSVVAAGTLLEEVRRREPGIRTCLGGVHVSSRAAETMARFPSVDICAVGEAEVSLLELLGAVASGEDAAQVPGLVVRRGTELIQSGRRPPLTAEELNRLPWPAWDLLPDLARTYRPAMHSFRRLPCTSLVTSRGCPGRCTFCDRTVSGTSVRGFSADYLLGMVRHLVERYGIREIIFHDDNFVTLRSRLVEFCGRLIDEGPRLSWSCTARIDMVSPETLTLMRRAGCWQIAYGIESGSQAILDAVHKGISLEQIRRAVAWTVEAGIEPRGFFVIGLPGETRETLRQTREFLMSLPLGDFQMSIFAPHPGTEVTAGLHGLTGGASQWERGGGWLVTYIPEGLTGADLLATQRQCMRDFYLRPGTVLRYARRLAGAPGAWVPLCRAAAQLARNRVQA